MDRLITAVEHLRQLPGAFVDTNFRQVREAFRAQLSRIWQQAGQSPAVSDVEVDKYIYYCLEDIDELKARVIPYTLPSDYLFFLEYYGGLAIHTDSFRFEIYGCGPMTQEWYGDWVCDNWGEYNDPLLPGPRGFKIGYLRFDTASLENRRRNQAAQNVATYSNPFEAPWYPEIESKWIELRFDLAGNVQTNCIVGLGPDQSNTIHPLSVGDNDRRIWKVLATSFTEFIERATQTNAQFGYKNT
jgi:hypothetical protein